MSEDKLALKEVAISHLSVQYFQEVPRLSYVVVEKKFSVSFAL